MRAGDLSTARICFAAICYNYGMQWNYVVIPFIALAVGTVGSLFAARDVPLWYTTIKKPRWTPSGGFFGVAWTIIYAFGAIAALIVWNATVHDALFWVTIAVFIVNAVLNAVWTYIFFRRHLMKAALWDSIALEITIIILIALTIGNAPYAALALAPYCAWVAFATALNYAVWKMNLV